MIVFTTLWKGGYIAAVKNIYGIPLPPQEEHHNAIDNFNTIVHVSPGNADTELRTGVIGTSQCIPYQFQLMIHENICTYKCDNECNASASKDIVIDNN